MEIKLQVLVVQWPDKKEALQKIFFQLISNKKELTNLLSDPLQQSFSQNLSTV